MMKLEIRKAQRQNAVPELTPSRPRPVRLNGSGWVVAIVGVLLAAGSPVGGIWLYSAGVRNRDLRRSIEAQGIPAGAVVAGLSRTRGEHPKYIVSYRYPAGERFYNGRGSIRRAEWAKLQIGSGLTVRYLPSNPARSWVLGYEPRQILFWVGPVVALSLAFFAWIAWNELRKQWMLLSEGRPAEARVVGSKKILHSHGRANHNVRYEFRLMSGAMSTGKYGTQKSPPEAGTTIRIVYDPDNPKRNAPYPLSLVRPF
jgi:hypothetical protein